MADDTHSAERLKQLHQRIEQWRLTRTQHGPMPGEHWEEATWLARSLGVSPVARALGLGYRSLVSFRQACVSGAQALGYRPEPGQRDRKDGNFRWWPTSTEAASAPLRAHELQVLLCGGDPSATQAAPQWRKVGS